MVDLIRAFFFLILSYIFMPLVSVHASNYIESNFPELYARHQIEEMGDRLVEEGRYEEALAKYQEALDPKYIKNEDDKGSPIGRITRVLILLERYDEALQEWQWYLNQSEKNAARRDETNNGEAELKAQEIKALKEYKKNGNPKWVYDYLAIYKQKKYKSFPPSFEWGSGPTETSTALRLYDTIGDHDAGILLIDEVLSFLKKHQAQFGDNTALYDSIKTSEEATKCSELDKKMKRRNPDWRTCNIIREHLLIREAFEKDKVDSTKGRATKALIQSDYFPW
jgi:hypothetical protein